MSSTFPGRSEWLSQDHRSPVPVSTSTPPSRFKFGFRTGVPLTEPTATQRAARHATAFSTFEGDVVLGDETRRHSVRDNHAIEVEVETTTGPAMPWPALPTARQDRPKAHVTPFKTRDAVAIETPSLWRFSERLTLSYSDASTWRAQPTSGSWDRRCWKERRHTQVLSSWMSGQAAPVAVPSIPPRTPVRRAR